MTRQEASSAVPFSGPEGVFSGLGLPANLVRLALASPDEDNQEQRDRLNSSVEQFLSTLPATSTSSLRSHQTLDVDVVIVAAMRTYEALLEGVPDATDRRGVVDRIRYGLIPVMKRLGMWEFKRRLEDQAFRVATPALFSKVEQAFATFREEKEGYVRWASDTLLKGLLEAGIKAEIKPVFCGVDGASRRLRRSGATTSFRGARPTDFFDLYVLVGAESECYQSLSAVHQFGPPLPGMLEDLIVAPRPGGFSGLLSCVAISPPGAYRASADIAQVIMQTQLMNEVSRFGVAQPRCYEFIKRGILTARERYIDDLISQFVDNGSSIGAQTSKSITVFTVGGSRPRHKNAWQIPEGWTVLDLAYKVHSELGDWAESAKANGRPVDLGHVLANRDLVQIRTRHSGEHPRRESDLRKVTTKHARKKLRVLLNSNKTTKGRLLVSQSLKQRDIVFESREDLDNAVAAVVTKCKGLREPTILALYDAVAEADARRAARTNPFAPKLELSSDNVVEHYPGGGAKIYESITAGSVGARIAQARGQQQGRKFSQSTSSSVWKPTIGPGVSIRSSQLNLCGRCRPRPSDRIAGVELKRSVAVHRLDCSRLLGHKTLPLEWKTMERTVRSELTMYCENRPRLVLGICERIARRSAHLEMIHATTDVYGRATITVHIYTDTAIALGDLTDDLRNVHSLRDIKLSSSSIPVEQRWLIESGDWQVLRRQLVHESGGVWPKTTLREPLKDAAFRRPPTIAFPYNEQKPAHESEHFYGRKKEVVRLIKLMSSHTGRYVLITGPRKIGKTSLALRFADSIDDKKVVYVDIIQQKTGSSDMVLRQIAEAMEDAICPGTGLSLGGDPRAAIDSIVSRCDKRVILVLDEFGAALQSFVNGTLGLEFFEWIRKKMNEPHSNGPYLIMAAPPEALDLLHRPGVAGYLDRLDTLLLSTLDVADAREMIVRPLKQNGVDFHRAALDQALSLTGGHPYHIIRFLTEIIDLLNTDSAKLEVTTSDVNECRDKALRNNETFFKGVIKEPGGDRASLECLHLLSRWIGDAKQYLGRGEILASMAHSESTVRAALERLVEFQLLEKPKRRLRAGSPDAYRFSIPLVREWVKKHENLESLAEKSSVFTQGSRL